MITSRASYGQSSQFKLWHRCVCRCPSIYSHDDVINWKHFPRYWPFVPGIQRSPVDSPHKGQNAELWCFFFYLRHKRLSKESRRRWLETPSSSLWRLCKTIKISPGILQHGRVLPWKRFPHCCPFVREIHHRWPMDSRTEPSHYMNQCWLIIRSSDILLRASSQEIPQPLITEIIWKIRYLKYHSNFPGANELIVIFHNQAQNRPDGTYSVTLCTVHRWVPMGWVWCQMIHNHDNIVEKTPIPCWSVLV